MCYFEKKYGFASKATIEEYDRLVDEYNANINTFTTNEERNSFSKKNNEKFEDLRERAYNNII